MRSLDQPAGTERPTDLAVGGQGTGKLSMVVWERFLLHLKPRTTQQERALYFEIASSFADTLDVLGFMDLRQASQVEIDRQRVPFVPFRVFCVWILGVRATFLY